jgi:hypothetical protein
MRKIEPELLLEFANERRFRRFVRTHFAARKLPQARHGFAGWAARQQHAPVRIDQRGRNDKQHARWGSQQRRQTRIVAALSSGSCH